MLSGGDADPPFGRAGARLELGPDPRGAFSNSLCIRVQLCPSVADFFMCAGKNGPPMDADAHGLNIPAERVAHPGRTDLVCAPGRRALWALTSQIAMSDQAFKRLGWPSSLSNLTPFHGG